MLWQPQSLVDLEVDNCLAYCENEASTLLLKAFWSCIMILKNSNLISLQWRKKSFNQAKSSWCNSTFTSVPHSVALFTTVHQAHQLISAKVSQSPGSRDPQLLKVSKSRKQITKSQILLKNERNTQDSIRHHNLLSRFTDFYKYWSSYCSYFSIILSIVINTTQMNLQ